MAYRVKGYFTKGERDNLERLIHDYYVLVNDEDIPQMARELTERACYFFVLLAQFALFADNVAIINKVVGGARG